MANLNKLKLLKEKTGIIDKNEHREILKIIKSITVNLLKIIVVFS